MAETPKLSVERALEKLRNSDKPKIEGRAPRGENKCARRRNEAHESAEAPPGSAQT